MLLWTFSGAVIMYHKVIYYSKMRFAWNCFVYLSVYFFIWDLPIYFLKRFRLAFVIPEKKKFRNKIYLTLKPFFYILPWCLKYWNLTETISKQKCLK